MGLQRKLKGLLCRKDSFFQRFHDIKNTLYSRIGNRICRGATRSIIESRSRTSLH